MQEQAQAHSPTWNQWSLADGSRVAYELSLSTLAIR